MPPVELELASNQRIVRVRLKSGEHSLHIELNEAEAHSFLGHFLEIMKSLEPADPDQAKRRLMWMNQPKMHVGEDDHGCIFLEFEPDQLPSIAVSLGRETAVSCAHEILRLTGSNLTTDGMPKTH